MIRLIPEGFAFASESSAADWIVTGVKPWGKERVRLWSFMPHVFESYARVFHPFHGHELTRIRWSEVAASRGVVIGPTTWFKDIAGGQRDLSEWEHEPSDGSVEEDLLFALRDALAQFTTTPDRCWLAVWAGWGSWHPGSRSMLVAATDPHLLPSGAVQTDMLEPPGDAARVRMEHREHFLLSSHLDLVPSFAILGWHQSPSLWWPEDRAWCVVTEVDGYSTYVGGAKSCVDAVTTSPRLEAIRVPADVRMDPGPY